MMIKPDVTLQNTDNTEDNLVLVVEIGQVKLSLPPRLSKIVHLFNEGNVSTINGTCKVHLDRDPLQSALHPQKVLTNGDILCNGHISPTPSESSPIPFSSPDLPSPPPEFTPLSHLPLPHPRLYSSESSPTPTVYDDVSAERRDYRALVKVHKSKRKLPELPTDPKMSIFNNIDKLGVLEAELDVKKLEVKIKRQRQKVAAEFRSMTPEQREELVAESPYLQKQIHRAINSRNIFRKSTPPDTNTTVSEAVSYSSTISSSTISCPTPQYTPAPAPRIVDYTADDSAMTSDIISHVCSERSQTETETETETDSVPTPSPLPLPPTIEDELRSCSSTPDIQNYSTAASTPDPYTRAASTTDPHYTDNILLTPTQSDSFCHVTSSTPNQSESDCFNHMAEFDELPPYDLTIVSPLKSSHVLEVSHATGDDKSDSNLSTADKFSLSDNTIDIDNMFLSDNNDNKKTLSDSIVSTVNLPTTPVNKQIKRSEKCTPHALSVSDSQLNRHHKQSDDNSYERTRSVPYGMEINNVNTDISDVLSRKFSKNNSEYNSKCISDKLEEIQLKLSPRSFLNQSQSVSSYTISYEEIGDNPKDSAAINLLFSDNDDYVDEMNRRNDKENLLNGFVSIDNSIEIFKDKEKDEKEEERKLDEMLSRLTEAVLDHFISVSAITLQPPPPPYISTDKVDMRVAHSEEEIKQTSEETVDYLTKCIRCGLPINTTNIPSTKKIPEYADQASYRAFEQLIQHQTLELFIQATAQFSLLSVTDTPPPWIREQVRPAQPDWLLKHTRYNPPTLSSIKPVISTEVVRLVTLPQYSIETILSKEVVQSDIQWQDFNKDEVALKFRLADIILTDLLQDTVTKLKDIDLKRTGIMPKSCESGHYNVQNTDNTPQPPVRLKRTNSF